MGSAQRSTSTDASSGWGTYLRLCSTNSGSAQCPRRRDAPDRLARPSGHTSLGALYNLLRCPPSPSTMATPLYCAQQSEQSFSGRHFVDFVFFHSYSHQASHSPWFPELALQVTYTSNVLRYQLAHLALMIYMPIHRFRADSS